MKTVIELIVLGLVACLTGCASTRSYFTDRGRDALDVATATVGIGAGVQARLGPFPLGLLQTSDVAGVRYGGAFCRLPTTEEPEEDNMTLVALGATLVSPLLGAFGEWDNDAWACYGEGVSGLWYYHNRFPMNGTQLRRNKGTENFRLPNCYQVEAVVGLGGTIRLGLNPGELLDFILGWTTIDICKDDIEKRRRIEQVSAGDTLKGALEK